MKKVTLFLGLAGMAFASLGAANATVVATFPAQRGTITAGGVSLGAFTASDTSLSFQGTVWNGDATAYFYFDDLALPSPVDDVVTLTYPPASTPPMTNVLPYGTVGFVAGAGAVAPLFFSGNLTSSSVTLTHTGGATKFTGAIAGTVPGGGTFTQTVSGTIGADLSVSLSIAMRLTDVDAGIYGGASVLYVSKITGAIVPPTPPTPPPTATPRPDRGKPGDGNGQPAINIGEKGGNDGLFFASGRTGIITGICNNSVASVHWKMADRSGKTKPRSGGRWTLRIPDLEPGLHRVLVYGMDRSTHRRSGMHIAVIVQR
ncbi:MAG: hypothetical protein ACREKL_03035 [Chthoniobacterales bacterium]